MDQQLLAKIAQIFEQLQCRLSLLDEGGAWTLTLNLGTESFAFELLP